MIIDTFKNIKLYSDISERLQKGLRILLEPELINKPDGKYQVEGDDIYYLVQRYKTKKPVDAKFEAHRKYIDIQALLKGREIIGFENIARLKENVPYKEDILFFETPGQYTELKLHDKMFAVLFPEDGHMPGLDFEEQQNDVVKIVVKVKI